MAEYPVIQGKVAGSWPEVYMAMALDKAKIRYDYQYVLFQSRNVRGAVVVDFVLYNPFAIPMEIYGKYWHTGKLDADDKFKLQLERNYFKREPIVVWDFECDTPEKAEQWVREHL